MSIEDVRRYDDEAMRFREEEAARLEELREGGAEYANMGEVSVAYEMGYMTDSEFEWYQTAFAARDREEATRPEQMVADFDEEESPKRQRSPMAYYESRRAKKRAEILVEAVDLVGKINRLDGRAHMLEAEGDYRESGRLDEKIRGMRRNLHRKFGVACEMCRFSMECIGKEEVIEELREKGQEATSKRRKFKSNMEVSGSLGLGEIDCEDAMSGTLKQTKDAGKWTG